MDDLLTFVMVKFTRKMAVWEQYVRLKLVAERHDLAPTNFAGQATKCGNIVQKGRQ